MRKRTVLMMPMLTLFLSACPITIQLPGVQNGVSPEISEPPPAAEIKKLCPKPNYLTDAAQDFLRKCCTIDPDGDGPKKRRPLPEQGAKDLFTFFADDAVQNEQLVACAKAEE